MSEQPRLPEAIIPVANEVPAIDDALKRDLGERLMKTALIAGLLVGGAVFTLAIELIREKNELREKIKAATL